MHFQDSLQENPMLALNVLLSSPRLRALSSGGSVTSPPPSPAMPKYKLAEYRYGREEMLALYVKDDKVSRETKPQLFRHSSFAFLKLRCGFKRRFLDKREPSTCYNKRLATTKKSPVRTWWR